MLLLLITLKQDKCKAAKCFGVYFETFWLATYLYSKFYKTYFTLYICKYMSLDHVYQILDNALIIFDIKTFTNIWYPTFLLYAILYVILTIIRTKCEYIAPFSKTKARVARAQENCHTPTHTCL